MDVAKWLEGLGSSNTQQRSENDIDFAVLDNLTDDADLKELGISSLGHRKRLLVAIAERGMTGLAQPKTLRWLPYKRAPAIHHLFADLCGFTAISRTLDPEEVSELVSRYTVSLRALLWDMGVQSTSTLVTRRWRSLVRPGADVRLHAGAGLGGVGDHLQCRMALGAG